MPQKKLIGRESEFTYLKKLLDDAILGKGHIVFIAGEAGIGKTRLVEELVSYAQDMGVLFVQGKCLYRVGADPYLPFTDALKEASAKLAALEKEGEELPIAFLTGLGAAAKDLGPMGVAVMEEGAPEKAEKDPSRVLDLAEELRRIDIGRQRDRMYETVSSMILEIARRRPLLLFLDDLHWADNATLQLLGYVVRSIHSSRVLLVASYRMEEVAPVQGRPHPLIEAIGRINREGISATLTLKRLDLRETRHLLSITLNRTDFPEGFVETIFRQTEGNPYFLEEVMKSLSDQGIINPRDSQWHHKVDMTALTIPSSVRAVITQRISRLEPAAMKTLQNASVLGQEFNFKVLAAISDLAEEDLVDALEKLMHARLVYEDTAGESEKYRFTYTMIREVAYENLSRTKRRLLHRKAAVAIEKVYRNNLDEVIFALAYHFSNAGDLPKSAEYFSEAGRKAVKSFAPEEAVRYFRKALEALEKLEAAPKNLKLEEEVLVSLGNVLYTIGEWDEALEDFGEVLKLSEETGSEGLRALSHLRMGEIGEKRSDWSAAAESFARAFEIYERTKDVSGQANVHRARVTMYWRKGEYQRALEEGTKGLLLLDKPGDKYLTAMTVITLGAVYYDLGDFARSRQYYEEGLALAEEIGDPLETARALGSLGNVEMKGGRLDAALGLFEKSIEAANRSGNIRQVGYALASTGECLARMGDLEKAMDVLDRSITIFEKLDERVMIGSIMMLRGIIHRNNEEWEMARKCFTESTRIVGELNMPYVLGEHLLEFGITCSMEGDRVQARRLFNQALHTFEAIGAKKYIEKTRAELRRLEEIDWEEEKAE
jgi:tetratricopeptide (TPR) repeat protein